MKKPSRLKRNTILLLESPLSLVVFLLNVVIAMITFSYIRVVNKGILMGRRLDKSLEFHEQGRKRE